jgi:hypothetical protein
MSMFLGLAESALGLTPEEKAVVEPALPLFKELLDALNPDWDALQTGLNLLVKGKPVFDRFIADLRVLGPAASMLLGEGMPDIFTASSTAKDMVTTFDLNKAWFSQLQTDGERFMPLVAKAQDLWPKIAPAVGVLVNAARRKGLV